MVTTEELEARVERGAALFDAEWGDEWWRNYPIEKLVSVQGCGCAADWAQESATGCYLDAKDLDGYDHLDQMNAFNALDGNISFGCNAMDYGEDIGTVAAWKRLILARQEAARSPVTPAPLLSKCVSMAVEYAVAK